MPLPVGLSFTAGAMAPAELEWQKVIQGRRELQAQQDAQRAWQEQLRSLTSEPAAVLPQQLGSFQPQGQQPQMQGGGPVPPMSGSSQPSATEPIGQDTYWGGAPDSPHFTLPQQSATVSPTGAGPIQPGAGAGPTSPGVPAASRQAPGGLVTPSAGGSAQQQQQEPFDPLQRVKQWAKEIKQAAPNAPPQVQAIMLQQRIALAKTAFPEEKLLMQSQVAREKLEGQIAGLQDKLENAYRIAAMNAGVRERGQNIQLYLGNQRIAQRDRLADARDAAKKAEAGSALTTEDKKALGAAWAAGETQAISGAGWGKMASAVRQEIQHYAIQSIREQTPGISDFEAGRILAANKIAFTGEGAASRTVSTQAAKIGLGARELQKFKQPLLDASAKVDRTKYPTLNSLLLAGERGTGDENVVRLISQVNAVKNAYQQVAKRGGQNTDDAARRADEVMSYSWSTGQISAGLDQLMIEADAALSAAGEAQQDIRRQITGGGASPGGPAAPSGNVDTSGWELVK